MRDTKKGNKERTTDRMFSDKLSQKSRNVSKLQEKQTKRGRFTKFS